MLLDSPIPKALFIIIMMATKGKRPPLHWRSFSHIPHSTSPFSRAIRKCPCNAMRNKTITQTAGNAGLESSRWWIADERHSGFNRGPRASLNCLR